MSKLTKLGSLAAVGAGLTYFFDPDRGRARRAQLRDRTLGLFRRAGRKVEQRGRYVGAQAYGLKKKVENIGREERMPESDRVLVDKVESEVLRRANYPKGAITVEACDGIITLRGQAETADQITRIEKEVTAVTGVAGVENFLHLPGTQAPNKASALDAGR
jgi:osmotically-inducible protein OsmY